MNNDPDGYTAIPQEGCDGCAFLNDDGKSCDRRAQDFINLVLCSDFAREDNTSVIFIKKEKDNV